MRVIGALVLAILLLGCSNASPPRDGREGTAQPSYPIESVRLGQTMEEVRAAFGDPPVTKTVTTLRKSDVWTYESLGFSVQFVDGKLISATQSKGSISNGLTIGDSVARVSELDISVVKGVVSQTVGYIKQEVGLIEIHIEGDRVIRFVYGPGPESDL